MNSEKEGTPLILSLKYVGRRFGVDSGFSASVANEREVMLKRDLEAWRRGGAFRHRNLVTAAAILKVGCLYFEGLKKRGDG